MRRLLAMMLILLVHGVMLTFLVAWTCSLLISPDPLRDGLDPVQLNRVRREFFERAGPDPGGGDPGTLFVTVVHSQKGVEFLDLAVEDRDLGADAFNGPLPYIGVTRAGWPLIAVEAQWYRDASRAMPVFAPRTTGGFAFRDWYVRGDRLFMPRMLPYKPLWPAFTLDVAFWTVVAAVLWFVPIWIRRLIRRRRGQCAGCGYPIGASEVCTECGREVQGAVTARR
jgi:hypothetical protein